jgi:hypothetical protein
MSGETEAAGILSASAQKLKQEIAIKITNLTRSKAGGMVRGSQSSVRLNGQQRLGCGSLRRNWAQQSDRSV